MGHVISTGLELVGTGSSVLRNERLASAVRKTVELANCKELTFRERNHVKAMELFSKGWVHMKKTRSCMRRFIWWHYECLTCAHSKNGLFFSLINFKQGCLWPTSSYEFVLLRFMFPVLYPWAVKSVTAIWNQVLAWLKFLNKAAFLQKFLNHVSPQL